MLNIKLDLLNEIKELNKSLKEKENTHNTLLLEALLKLSDLCSEEVNSVDVKGLVKIVNKLLKITSKNSQNLTESALEDLKKIANALNELKTEKDLLKYSSALNQIESLLETIFWQEFYAANETIVNEMSACFGKLANIETIKTEDFIDQEALEFNEKDTQKHLQKVSKISKKLDEVNKYIEELDYLEEKLLSISNSVSDFKLDEKHVENFHKAVFSLREIGEKLQKTKNEFKLKLPLTPDSIISNIEIKPKSDAPKKAVIIRLFNRPGMQQRKIFGIRSNGHISMEIIDGNNSKYISLATDGEPLGEEKTSFLRSVAKKSGSPTNNIFKGVFVHRNTEEIWWNEGFYQQEKGLKIVIDCTKEDTLDTAAMIEWAGELLKQYQNTQSNDYQKYPYQLYTNNCSTVVLKGLETGGAGNHGVPLPKFIFNQVTTPQETFDFVYKLNAKFDKANYEDEIKQNQNKTYKERWSGLINYHEALISMMDTMFLEYKLAKIDCYEIKMPKPETLKENIVNYKIEDTNDIIKVTQAIYFGTVRQLEKASKNEEIDQVLSNFYQLLVILREHMGLLELDEKTEEGKRLLEFDKQIYLLIKSFPQFYQEQFNSKNKFYVNQLHNLLNNEKELKKDNIHHNYKKNSEEEVKNESVEASILNTVKESNSIAEIEMLFRSNGLHEPCGNFNFSNKQSIYLTNTQWHGYEENGEIIKNSKACENSFKFIIQEAKLNEQSKDTKHFDQAQKILDRCLAPLKYTEFSDQDVNVDLFKKIVLARNALVQLRQLAKEDRSVKTEKENTPKLFDEKLYHQASNLVRGYLGGVYKHLYFDGAFSYDREAKANLSAQIQQIILPGENLSSSVTDFVSNTKNVIQLHKKEQFSQKVQDNYDTIEKSVDISKPPVWKFWRRQERTELTEIEIGNKISKLLKEDLLPLQKYNMLSKMINANVSGKYNLFGKENRERYLNRGLRAGLLCLTEAFSEGHITEPKFMVQLEMLNKQFGTDKENLNSFIGNFRNKYVEYIQLVENNKSNNDKVSLIDNLKMQLEASKKFAKNLDFKKLYPAVSKGHQVLFADNQNVNRNQQKAPDKPEEVAVDIELEIERKMYRGR